MNHDFQFLIYQSARVNSRRATRFRIWATGDCDFDRAVKKLTEGKAGDGDEQA